jgi:hypothetical protein
LGIKEDCFGSQDRQQTVVLEEKEEEEEEEKKNVFKKCKQIAVLIFLDRGMWFEEPCSLILSQR